MNYSSSYAVGAYPPTQAPQPWNDHGAGAQAAVLPPPPPQRLHWSTLVFVGGLGICLLALLATLAGIPGKAGYDLDGAPNRNKPSSSDPLKLTQSMDGNMKWIADSSSDRPGGYVGYIKSVNRSEAAIPAMVSATVAMDEAVREMDAGIGKLSATTAAMGKEMQAMTATSAASAKTMAAVGGDIGFLSKSMLSLADATQQLTVRMTAIERKAGRIASNGTSAALATTRELNSSLPDSVPVPITEDGTPLTAAASSATGGGGAAASGQPVDATTYDAWQTGAVQ